MDTNDTPVEVHSVTLSDKQRNIWHLVDPSAPTAPTRVEPTIPLTPQELTDRANQERRRARELWIADPGSHQEPKNLSTTDVTLTEMARQEYRAVLAVAERGRVNPARWYNDWFNAYLKARAYAIPEIQGQIGTRDFLRAISKHLAPDWGQRQFHKLIENEQLSLPSYTLEQYGLIFQALTREQEFATLGGMKPQDEQSKLTCPCISPSFKGKVKHSWKASECRRVKAALSVQQRSKDQEEIVTRLSYNRWKSLRETLQGEGLVVKKKKNSKTPTTSAELPDKPVVSGVHALNTPHPLSACTLFASAAAINLVNNKALLEPGSFVPAQFDEIIESGTQQLSIAGYGKRIIKNVFDGPRGPRTGDLVLTEVAVVEGFHVNIVSQARLRAAGVWYLGLDCSLRYGTMDKNVVLAKLTQKFNLVFLQYKPLGS